MVRSRGPGTPRPVPRDVWRPMTRGCVMQGLFAGREAVSALS